MYRAYYKDTDGRILGLPEIIRCSDDETAIKRAELHAVGEQIEIWHGSRLVAVLPRRAKLNP
jgi:hypothetical protein